MGMVTRVVSRRIDLHMYRRAHASRGSSARALLRLYETCHLVSAARADGRNLAFMCTKKPAGTCLASAREFARVLATYRRDTGAPQGTPFPMYVETISHGL